MLTLVTLIPVLMMVIGALGYFASTNPKVQELSRLVFAAGSFGLAIGFATKAVTLA